MIWLLAQFVKKIPPDLRLMFPTLSLVAMLVMARDPELWALTQASGELNGLPLLVIGCLLLTYIDLLTRDER
jgi:hypothetical protein